MQLWCWEAVTLLRITLPFRNSRADKVREFFDRFLNCNGSTECIRLIVVDITTDKGYTFAKENNLFGTRCEKMVLDSVKILEALISADSNNN